MEEDEDEDGPRVAALLRQRAADGGMGDGLSGLVGPAVSVPVRIPFLQS